MMNDENEVFIIHALDVKRKLTYAFASAKIRFAKSTTFRSLHLSRSHALTFSREPIESPLIQIVKQPSNHQGSHNRNDH